VSRFYRKKSEKIESKYVGREVAGKYGGKRLEIGGNA
jgi:hypothetical protein